MLRKPKSKVSWTNANKVDKMARDKKSQDLRLSERVCRPTEFFYRLSALPPFVVLLLICALSCAVTGAYMASSNTTSYERANQSENAESDSVTSSKKIDSSTLSEKNNSNPDADQSGTTAEDQTGAKEKFDELPGPLRVLCVAYLLWMLKDNIVKLRYETQKKKNRLAGDIEQPAKLNFLNTPTSFEIPIPTRHVWTALKDNLQQEIIKGTDTRRTHWEILRADQMQKKMDLMLRYTNDPLGRKPYQVSSRNLTCSIKLNTGGGQKTQVELTFTARNPMDYQTVIELIERTKTAIRQVAMEAELVDSY
jgi:hypothetical protein